MTVYERIEHNAYFTIDPRPTPALFKGLPEIKSVSSGVLEPFCGAGHMAEDIRDHGLFVYSGDMYDYGYKGQIFKIDFLDFYDLPIGCNTIISNPPYNRYMTDKFIRHGLDILPNGGLLCLLLKHGFDAAGQRSDLFDVGSHFYKKINLPFRIWWFEPTEDSKDPAENHAWFVWAKGWKRPSENVYLHADDFADYPKRSVRDVHMHCGEIKR